MIKLIQILLLLISVKGYNYAQNSIDNRVDAYGKLQSGAYHEAINAFSEIEISGKLVPQDRLSLAIAQFRIGDLSAARRNFQLSEEAGVAESNLWLARIYATNRNDKDALLFIERYLKTSKNPDIRGIQMDSSFRFMHQTDMWFDLWQNDWNSANQKIVQEAMFYSGRKKYSVAHQIIESAKAENLSNADLYLCNAKIYMNEENTALALNEINQALRLDPLNTAYLKERANYNLILNNYELALEDLNQVISINPVDFEVRYLRAKTAFLAKNLELASDDISLYLQYFTSEEALFTAGQISYTSEDYFNALKYYNRLMKDARPNASYFKARGMTYYESSNYSLASNDLSMSLDLDPENGETNFFMGLAEYYKGNTKAACYFWNRAKKNGELKAAEYLQKYCK